MYSWNDPDDRAEIVQMNAELRHAQLDLLSAQCATDRLRLRYTLTDLARFCEKTTLRKAIGAAVALRDYYVSIQKEMSPGSLCLTEVEMQQAVKRVASYLWSQRELHSRIASPLTPVQRQPLQAFFQPGFLDRVRTLELRGRRLPPPPFYDDARALGFDNLPAITHMSSVTFVDTIVFHGQMQDRALFHGLVHAVQFDVLGLERYTDCFVRSFLRTQAHFNVPLEKQAFDLESRFALDPQKPFSVEQQVRLWLGEGRYSS